MYNIDSANIIFSFMLTWGIGLTPPLVIRYAILKRPMRKWPAISTSIFLWLINLILFSILGSQNNTHTALSIVMLVSYWILQKKPTPKEQAQYQLTINDTCGNGTTILMAAAMLGKIKQIQELISAGANIDAMDENGWTPLMYAASRNEVTAVKFLLKHGANHTLQNNEKLTATEIAQNKENFETVTILQNLTATDNIPNAVPQ